MSKKNYTVKTPINHDQVDYAPGSHIELDETHHAKPLLAIGAIEMLEPSAAGLEEAGADNSSHETKKSRTIKPSKKNEQTHSLGKDD